VAAYSAPTELDSFTLSFLQICQSYGLCRLRFRRNFDNSPAFQGWDSSRANIKVPSGTTGLCRRPPCFLSSLTGLANLPDDYPAINGRAIIGEGFFVSFDYSDDALREIESFFKRSHKVIVALTVKEILDEQIAKKLV
jgi:hypothetical protein